MKVTELRTQIYKVFDHVVKTGRPIVVTKGENMIKIVPAAAPDKLANLKNHKSSVGNIEDLDSANIHTWSPDDN